MKRWLMILLLAWRHGLAHAPLHAGEARPLAETS
jgi:hypothetical protein